jgi:hypothetical protein
MRFLFKRYKLKQGKHGLVYQRNRLQGNRTKGNGMEIKEENPSCKHCKKEGHEEDHCWQVHPEKRLKWFKKNKGRQTVAATTLPTYLRSDSGD